MIFFSTNNCLNYEALSLHMFFLPFTFEPMLIVFWTKSIPVLSGATREVRVKVTADSAISVHRKKVIFSPITLHLNCYTDIFIFDSSVYNCVLVCGKVFHCF